MRATKSVIIFLLTGWLLVATVSADETLDYQLTPILIAKDTYVFIGEKEDINRQNGGNIVNTGFIVTASGVIVIDVGPSYIYGRQMRAAISELTDKPILKVFITHHHPDHVFGYQAFIDVPIYALPATIKQMSRDADSFLDNMYRLAGRWMKGTENRTEAIQPLIAESDSVSDHTLNYINMRGHTESDLMIFDETTGVLFTGDLVFHNRALTTPHAIPGEWENALNAIINMEFNVLVPGHGEVANNRKPVEQTKAYLNWLETNIEQSVAQGMTMTEVLMSPIPENFRELSVVEREFSRSVSHRYPVYEQKLFE